MRHLKLYEMFNDGREQPEGLAVADFVLGSYWRYRNRLMDSIMKVIDIKENVEFSTPLGSYKKPRIYFKVLDTMSKQNDGGWKYNDRFIFLDFCFEDLQEIIKLDSFGSPKKILRLATEEEIEKFEIKENIGKYNL